MSDTTEKYVISDSEISIDFDEIVCNDISEIAESYVNAVEDMPFNVHVTTDQSFFDRYLEPNDITIIVKRSEHPIVQLGQENWVYMLILYIDNAYIDLGKDILDTYANKYRGIKKSVYVSDYNSTTETVTTDLYDSSATYSSNATTTKVELVPSKSSIMQNMMPVGRHYCTALYSTVQIAVAKNVNGISKIEFYNSETGEYEEIDFLQATVNAQIQQQPSPFADSNGIARSLASFAVVSLQITCINKNDAFNNYADKAIFGAKTDTNNHDYTDNNINQVFKFKIYYGLGGNVSMDADFFSVRMNNYTLGQQIGGNPAKSYSFVK